MSKPNEESGSSGEKRTKNKLLDEASKKLQELSISKGAAIMAPNGSPGTLGTKVDVRTNIYGLAIVKEQGFWRYDVSIEVELGGKVVSFTKKGKDDFLVLSRRDKCIFIMKTVFEKHADFFKVNKFNHFYDGQSILYSTADFFAGITEQSKKFKLLVLPAGSLAHDDLHNLPVDVHVTIKAVHEDYSMSLTNEAMVKKTANSDLSQNDTSIAQFIEIVIGQHGTMNPDRHAAFENGKSYLVQPWKDGFDVRDCPDVGDKKRLMPGTQKSLRYIEGPRGRGYNNPSIVIDAKKAAFHEDCPLINKAHEICKENFGRPVQPSSLEKLNGVLKGLFVYTKYTKKIRNHQITGISQKTALTAEFDDKDGKRTNVNDFFKKTYSITLNYPNAPLVMTKERGQLNFYPMEVCDVRGMQRVTIPQQTSEQSQRTTKECAVAPAVRKANIDKGIKALELYPGNPYIENAGLKVYGAQTVAARQLYGPSLRYGSAGVKTQEGKWKAPPGQSPYLFPAKCTMWAIYAVNHQNDRSGFNTDMLTAFAKSLLGECRKHGLQFPNPTECRVIKESEVFDTMSNAAKHNCQFCFFVSSDSITSLHGNLKLWERKLQMVTQDMKASNARKVVVDNKWQTMENVVLKTNIKLGGLNYGVDVKTMGPESERWLHGGRLVIGVGISHAPPTAMFDLDKGGKVAPTVIGYCANVKKHSCDFVGDFMYQETRREETLTTLNTIVKNCITRFKSSHDGRAPIDVIIYRSGISEGSFSSVLTHEIPLARLAMKDVGADTTKIVFIVAQKEHNVRLFMENINPNDRPTQQNIKSGIVIDEKISHPAFKEFYLNSHTTLQGSARTPRYTVLVDDQKLSMDELEGMTYALTFGHQIVNLATSLPTPLYVANRYAERGRLIFNAHIQQQENGTNSSDSAPHNLEELTAQLSYHGSRLSEYRVNA